MEIEWIKVILKLHRRCKFLQVYIYLIRAVINMLLRGFRFNIGEFKLLSGVDLQCWNISDRPSGNRGDKHRSGRENGPHRSLHAFLLETSLSWITQRRGEQGNHEVCASVECFSCFICFTVLHQELYEGHYSSE